MHEPRTSIRTKNFDLRCWEKERERGRGKCALRETAHPFRSPPPSRFLDFLPVWPRLNYRKPCFGCHGRIPISRRVARVAGTPYGVSRILYEFLSWNDSFICLSSIPSPPPALRSSLALSIHLPPSPLSYSSFFLSRRHRRKSLYLYLSLFSSDRTLNLESLQPGTGRLD